MRRWSLAIVAVLVIASGVGIGQHAVGVTRQVTGSSVDASTTSRVVAQEEGDHGDHGGDDHAAPKPDALVSELQALVSHQATLATRLTRAALTDDPGFVDAAESALVRNIDDLEAALTPAVGAEAAERLSSQWERQTQSLFQSATGLRDDQQGTTERAEQRLDRIADEQASALADLGDGRVDGEHVAELLQSYFDDHLEQLERYAAGDYGRAYELQRKTFAAAFPIGEATASAGVRVPEPSPTDELRTALSRLLGEHVELAVDTMRAGATGSDDFEAAADALDANTRDMAAAMDALFGAKQAQKFNEVWADHIDLFVDYTVAVVEGDDATKRAVRDQFSTVMRRFGTALEDVTSGLVEADVVTAAMGEHEQQLIDQIEQYASDDYTAAHEVSYTAYQHIRHVADVLATPFAKAVAKDMPRGGSQTGGGGTALQ